MRNQTSKSGGKLRENLQAVIEKSNGISVLETPGTPVTGTPSIYLAFYSIYNRWAIDGDPSIKELLWPFEIDGEPVTGIPGDSRTEFGRVYNYD